MGSGALTTLTLFLGFFFIFAAMLKLTPFINREMHREIRRNFVQYAKVLPFSSILKIKVSPITYRLIYGWLELTGGLMLTVFPGIFKQIANVVLLILTSLSIYTHFLLDDKFERTAPAIVFTLMLTCRLVIYWQVKRRDSQQQQVKAKKN